MRAVREGSHQFVLYSDEEMGRYSWERDAYPACGSAEAPVEPSTESTPPLPQEPEDPSEENDTPELPGENPENPENPEHPETPEQPEPLELAEESEEMGEEHASVTEFIPDLRQGRRHDLWRRYGDAADSAA